MLAEFRNRYAGPGMFQHSGIGKWTLCAAAMPQQYAYFPTLSPISSLCLSATTWHCNFSFCIVSNSRRTFRAAQWDIYRSHATTYQFLSILTPHCCCCFNDRLLFGRPVARSIIAFSSLLVSYGKTSQAKRRRVVPWPEACRRVCATSTEKCASPLRFRYCKVLFFGLVSGREARRAAGPFLRFAALSQLLLLLLLLICSADKLPALRRPAD